MQTCRGRVLKAVPPVPGEKPLTLSIFMSVPAPEENIRVEKLQMFTSLLPTSSAVQVRCRSSRLGSCYGFKSTTIMLLITALFTSTSSVSTYGVCIHKVQHQIWSCSPHSAEQRNKPRLQSLCQRLWKVQKVQCWAELVQIKTQQFCTIQGGGRMRRHIRADYLCLEAAGCRRLMGAPSSLENRRK